MGDGHLRLGPFGQGIAPFDPVIRCLRASDRHPARRGQFHALQVARPVGQADGAIEVRLGKIGSFVRHEREAGRRMLRHEIRQSGRQPFGEEFARSGERIAVRRLSRLHRLDAFFELQKTFPQRVEPRRAFPGQFEPFRRATEQDRAEMILQRADLLSHRGRGHGELVGGAGKAEMARRGIVDAQGVQGQVRALHGGGGS